MGPVFNLRFKGTRETETMGTTETVLHNYEEVSLPILDSTGKMFSADKKRSFPPNKRRFFNGEPLPRRNTKHSLIQQNMQQCRKWGVITTVYPPSEAVRRFTYLNDWCLVIVGDKTLPESYNFQTTRVSDKNVVFLSGGSQSKIDSKFVGSLPWHSFGRKNVGYLYAVANGAEVIYDFDDNNMLKFWIDGATTDTNLWIDKYTDIQEPLTVRATKGNHIFFNPYPSLNSPSDIWPRGFPLSLSRNHSYSDLTAFNHEKIDPKSIGVLQSVGISFGHV